MMLYSMDAKILQYEKFVDSLNVDDFDVDKALDVINNKKNSFLGEYAEIEKRILDEVIFNNLLLGSPKQIALRKSGVCDRLFSTTKGIPKCHQ